MLKSVLEVTPRRVAAIVLAIALPIAAGCGGSKGDVSGKVTYKGQPLPYGNVQFMSPAGAFAGEIQPDGTYSVSGVPIGMAKVAVNCQDGPGYEAYMKALSAAGRDKAAKPKGHPDDFNKIPGKYFNFDQSGLTYEVKSGQQTYNIDLK